MSLLSTREFLLQEKIGSLRDKVWVMNTNKEKLGYFKGKIIKVGNTFRLYDMNDNPILTVHEKLISMRSTYTFYWGGEKEDDKFIGKLKKKLVSIKPSYWFEDKDENKVFTMKGNVFSLKYKILKDGKQVAEISKKFFKSLLKDSYGVKIDPTLDDQSAMLILGIVIMLHHEKEENR
ncbi:MAG: LURP-one-related/scramblase family protein [Promethearchaeia archaeon]